MRYLLLDTTRDVDAYTIASWRHALEMRPEDELALVSWQPPREPLPIAAQYVFGPRFDPLRPEPVRFPTSLALPPVYEGQERHAGQEITATNDAQSSLNEEDLAEQMTEQLAPEESREVGTEHDALAEGEGLTDGDDLSEAVDETDDESGQETQVRPGTLHLPVYHPARINAALAWRMRRVRRAARRVGPKALRAASTKVAAQFAMGMALTRVLTPLVKSADIVVPMDNRSQQAAWVLSRRWRRPAVPANVSAAVRVAQARRDQR